MSDFAFVGEPTLYIQADREDELREYIDWNLPGPGNVSESLWFEPADISDKKVLSVLGLAEGWIEFLEAREVVKLYEEFALPGSEAEWVTEYRSGPSAHLIKMSSLGLNQVLAPLGQVFEECRERMESRIARQEATRERDGARGTDGLWREGLIVKDERPDVAESILEEAMAEAAAPCDGESMVERADVPER